MDLEPCFKVHNLAIIQLKDTKLGQMTNLKVVFHMVIFYKFVKISKSSRPSPLLNFKVANCSYNTEKKILRFFSEEERTKISF